MSRFQQVVSLLFFMGFIVGCENGPNFSPTAPSVVLENDNSMAISETSSAITTQNCGNPNDQLPDDDLFQRCLDVGGEIRLQTGEPGYIIDKGLLLRRSGTVITSDSVPNKVKIIAGRDLFSFILKTEDTGLHNFSIEYVSFNGMVDERASDGPYRRRLGGCGEMSPGNVVLAGRDFSFNHSESKHALCGTGLGLYGKNFKVIDNNIYSNGRDKNSGTGGLSWSDGMTVLYCGGGYIAHNTVEDNTDIDLVLGGGRGCVVELNTITHRDKHAFAGLAIGNFSGDGAGDHSGSEYRSNTVFSTRPNVLSVGILVGSHPWSSGVNIRNAGIIIANTSYGNVMNFVVDGVYGGEISGNTIRDPQGEDSLCGRRGENFTVFPPHSTGTIIQEGWTEMMLDDWSCGSQSLQSDRLRMFSNGMSNSFRR